MKILPFILISCYGLLIACNPQDAIFPHEEILVQELMPLQGITNPMKVEVKYPYLILQNSEMHDSIFHIYDLTTHKLKSVFGTKGQGPDEWVSPLLFQTSLPDLLIGDFSKNKIYRFNINKEGDPIFKEAKRLGYENALYDAAFINDSLFIVDPKYMLVPSLYLLAQNDSLPRKIWTYRNPDIIDYMLDPDMGNVYANKDRIIFCYGYKKQIDFMDTNFNLIKRTKFKYDSPSYITGDNYGDIKVSYVYSYLGEHYLYALFFGTSWKDNRANATHGTFIEVFDLNGNPVIRYHLEGKRPVNFAIDEVTFTLYGTTEDGDPEDNLLIYNLKGLS